jgi:16S rRNA (uracil1498-N3)-methyltransferase
VAQIRIYTPQSLTVGADIKLEATPSRHLAQVLRLRPGAGFSLFNGDGHHYDAKLIESDRKACLAFIEKKSPAEPSPLLEIELALGISRGERMDFALQKAVELGVARIQPLVTERTQGRLTTERQNKRHAHWQQVIWSACEQSGRGRIPPLKACLCLTDYMEQPRLSTGTNLLLHPDAESGLNSLAPPKGSVCLLSGPEGGLSEAEIELALSRGFISIRLGPRVLRAETAPLAALAAIQTLWGDFRN